MKKIVILVALGLAGCGPGGSSSTTAGDSLNMAAFINAVQVGAKGLCGAVPLAEDLAKVYEDRTKGKGDNVAFGDAIAKALCAGRAAISAVGIMDIDKTVEVNGVKVRFLK